MLRGGSALGWRNVFSPDPSPAMGLFKLLASHRFQLAVPSHFPSSARAIVSSWALFERYVCDRDDLVFSATLLPAAAAPDLPDASDGYASDGYAMEQSDSEFRALVFNAPQVVAHPALSSVYLSTPQPIHASTDSPTHHPRAPPMHHPPTHAPPMHHPPSCPPLARSLVRRLRRSSSATSYSSRSLPSCAPPRGPARQEPPSAPRSPLAAPSTCCSAVKPPSSLARRKPT